MAYRTILVHVNDARRTVSLLSHAVGIARLFDARLIGLHVFPAPFAEPAALPEPGGLGVGGNDEPARLEAVFRDLTEKERFVSEWRQVPFERADPAGIVIARARAA